MGEKIKVTANIALRTVAILVLSAMISALSHFMFVDNMFCQEYFSEQVLNVWHFVFFLLIFNSLTIGINQYDKYSRENFLERVKDNKLIYHIKFIVSSVDFYIEIVCIIVLSVILPVEFLYGFVSAIFFHGMELTALNNKLYTLLIILPIMVALLFIARINLQKSWYLIAHKNANSPTKEKNSRIPPVLKSVITVAVVYCGASIVIPWFLPMFVTLWNLGGVMLFVWVLLALLALILITITAYYIRAMLKRRSFVKKLKKYCIANSVYLSDIKKSYLSLFVSQDGFDFTVEKSGTKYDCKFIAGIFPNSPIILTDKGNGIKQDTIRIFKIELFHFLTRVDFGYESEGKKILVLLPIPKKFFVSVNEAPPHLADVGEKVGEYTIYNSTGFLNALDRGTL